MLLGCGLRRELTAASELLLAAAVVVVAKEDMDVLLSRLALARFAAVVAAVCPELI